MKPHNKNRKILIKSGLATFLLSGCMLASHAGAIQAYSDGVQPLLVRLAEIERSLVLYSTELASGKLTTERAIYLQKEKAVLMQEQLQLKEQLELSSRIEQSGMVSYAQPNGASEEASPSSTVAHTKVH